ncbi:autotransporter outer membrane beta-barrel domain-containing protein [Lysobacter sp. CA199]|uniref:autotransporter outer membrane beta-barrel domain-containing protein n=1 Tax=Lysobacter sp. CA199 TaxID=3455608 RepID=UPI003F8D3344
MNRVRKDADLGCSDGKQLLAQAIAIICGGLLPVAPVLAQTIPNGVTVTVPGTYPSPWQMPVSSDQWIAGHLIVESGGVVNSAGPLRIHVELFSPPQANAGVIVRGDGAVWNHKGQLCVACNNTAFTSPRGFVRVENGGVVNVDDTVFASRGFAEIDITGRGSVWNTNTLQFSIGYGVFTISAAILKVSDGAVLNSSGLAVVGVTGSSIDARQSNGAVIRIDGEGTQWNASGGMSLRTSTEMIISSQGTVSAPSIEMLPRGVTGAPIRGSSITFGGAVNDSSGRPDLVPDAPVAAGRLDTDVINIRGAGSINFNHTESDYRFSTKLVGGDDPAAPGFSFVNVFAGTTRLTADNSAFNGQARVFGGKLLVDGVFGGGATINAGGTLGGNGRLNGNVLVNYGGRLAPGNSIGSLSVGGDLTFAPGSIYEAEVTPQGASDRVVVGGKATINGGSVVSLGQDSGFQPLTQYTILTASGGVSGRFAGASNNYAFLNPSLVYEPNAVKLQLLRNDVSFGSIGATANQRAAAAGAESTGPGNPVWNAVAVLSAEQARAALDSISGELHASTQTALIEDALSIQHAVLDGYTDSQQRGDMRVWIKALGARAQTDATHETAKLERDSSGLLFGADWALGQNWRLGALAGGGKTRNDVDARGSRSESDNLHYGLYADAAWENGWRLRLGGIRSDYDVDTRRRATVVGLGNSFTATTDARATQFYGELGYAFNAGAVELEPFLGASQIKLKTDGFGERGGVGALHSEDVDASTRYATLGLRLGYGFGDSSRWRLGGSLAWRRASGDLEPVSKLRFDGGQSFLVEGAPIARNAAVVTAGVSAQLSERISLNLLYLGQIASDADDHGASAKLIAKF